MLLEINLLFEGKKTESVLSVYSILRSEYFMVSLVSVTEIVIPFMFLAEHRSFSACSWTKDSAALTVFNVNVNICVIS